MSDIKLSFAQRNWLALVERNQRECNALASVAISVAGRGLTKASEVPGNDTRVVHTITDAGRAWLAAYRSKR